jgi:two-component system NtrC family sensor kinase
MTNSIFGKILGKITGKIQHNYSRLSLSYKIILPFLAIFLTVLIIGVTIIGYWFVGSLEANIQDDMNRAVPWVKREFTEQEARFLQEVTNFAKDKSLQIAITQGDLVTINRLSLPMKIKLHLDLLHIFDPQKNILLNSQSQQLPACQLDESGAIAHSLRGMPLFGLINCQQTPASILASISSIESREKLLGGVIFGRLMNDEILGELQEGIKEYLVAFNNKQEIIATTLAIAKEYAWQPPPINAPLQIVNIGNSQYLGQTIGLGGLDADKGRFFANENLGGIHGIR